jgi:hypothetical protein
MARFHFRSTTPVLFAMAITLPSCAFQHRTESSPTVSISAYEKAINAAAVRRPSWNVQLWSLGDGPTVTVGTFSEYWPLDSEHHYIWVVPPAQLWKMCRGKADPVLAMQQSLGLPPKEPSSGNEWRVIVFDVPSNAVFRPCPGDTRLNAENCPSGDAVDTGLDEATARFFLKQFWSAHHATVVINGKTDFGYPWTGMGWTYDWGPTSRTHVGASEFVVKIGTKVDHPVSLTPAEFCGASEPPTGVAIPPQ